MEDSDQLPDWLLERYLLGELPPQKLKEIEARLEDDPTARTRLAFLENDTKAPLGAPDPTAMAKAIERRHRVAKVAADVAAADHKRQRQTRWIGPAVLALAALGALMLLKPWQQEQVDGPDALITDNPGQLQSPYEITRDKGLEPRLKIYRKLSEGTEALKQGQQAQRDDLLQVRYIAAGRHHGVIISLDGNGAVTLHHPSESTGSTELKSGGETALPHAYKLDGAPKFERFFFVTSPNQLNVNEIMDAGRTLAADLQQAPKGPLNLTSDNLEQTSFMIRKETP